MTFKYDLIGQTSLIQIKFHVLLGMPKGRWVLPIPQILLNCFEVISEGLECKNIGRGEGIFLAKPLFSWIV